MTRKVLVVYATKAGATAGIATAIGAELRRGGHEVDVCEATGVGPIAKYDVVIVGSAIYMRRWRPEAVDFLRKHVHELRDRQVWLFHSGPVGPDKDQAQAMPRKVARLARKIGATPATTFAGRLEPETAKGFLAKHIAQGNLAADSREWLRIADWANDISSAISAVEHTP
ncbi:flavodoxin domain-containing protein [Kribbella sp. VKM Ac-2568]|uniref:flavodoxin domain-containing protein n=1 Tax=Kribbella sp. VKM Ac-2568 TaxID=2512219 RepID=UPI0018EE4D6C|nr:flavodoxin domain-containing protein [Kribbella sp. VKM Ac-2568]